MDGRVPVILFLIALASGSIAVPETAWLALKLLIRVIGIGVVTGILSAFLGGFALRTSAERNWIAGTWLQLPIIALALVCFGLAQWLGGSGFIASFVGGMTFGALTKGQKQTFLRAAEGTAVAVAMVTWFVFGTLVPGILLPGILLPEMSWRVLVNALASLTLVRMIPVLICLIGKA